MNKRVLLTGIPRSGKTTLLHLIESQLGDKVRYSHHANSSYGIPFDILDLHRNKLTADEWLGIFLLAPFRAFKKPLSKRTEEWINGTGAVFLMLLFVLITAVDLRRIFQ